MDKFTIDILLATYNGSKFIRQQIESILSQTYRNFRLLVRDDGSSDSTKQILKELAKKDPRIVLCDENGKNVGVNAGFEYLISQSTADYLMFSDQDDIWLPQKIETMIGYIPDHEFKTPYVVFSDSFIMFDEEKTNIRFLYNHIGRSPKVRSLKRSFLESYAQGAGILITGSFARKALPFNNIYMYDHFLTISAELFGRTIYVDKALMYYRQHANNVVGYTLRKEIKSNKWWFARFLFTEVKFNWNFNLFKDTREIISRYKNNIPVSLLNDMKHLIKSKRSILSYRALFRTGLSLRQKIIFFFSFLKLDIVFPLLRISKSR